MGHNILTFAGMNIYLFIYCIFNDIVSRSDYIDLNGKIINE